MIFSGRYLIIKFNMRQVQVVFWRKAMMTVARSAGSLFSRKQSLADDYGEKGEYGILLIKDFEKALNSTPSGLLEAYSQSWQCL